MANSIKTLSEEVEAYRDSKWRREDALRVDSAEQVEAMVEELGFCLGLTDARTNLPSVFTAVCGRRDAFLPRNVQKDEEASRAWVLKDEVIARGRLYYAKLIKGKSWFVAPRLIPAFNAIYGVPKTREARDLSGSANKILKVLRQEWEMASAELRAEAAITTRPRFNKALDKLQLTMKVVPQEVVYVPRFTYIWTLSEARFPKELKLKMPRDKAVRELARAYLTMCGMTLLGDTARTFGLTRREAGRANHELVDEGFAERLATGIYKLRKF